MARTSTYLNFTGKTAQAFDYYRSVFRTDFAGPILRMKDARDNPALARLNEAEKQMVMHVELPIVGGHVLMGTDALESMGHRIVFGTNVSINLEPDTREEARRLFIELAEGGKVTMELQDTFWGGYFGSLTDKYGVQWMVNCTAPK